jgi:competence ComEA-like helix-hairpin-helix protein
MNSFRSTRILALAFFMSGTAVTGIIGQTEAPRPVKPADGATAKVDLNNADRRTLETLPGVTPDIATAIIAARPFRSIDDLQKVKGIGTEHFEQLKAAVSVPLSPKEVARLLPPGAPARKPEPAKVDLNLATREKLEALPGATPQLAQAIIAARPFQSLADLDRVPGMTAEQLEQLRAAVTVSPATAGAARPPR